MAYRPEFVSHAMVGVRLPADLIARTVGRRPSCDHPRREGNAFCPDCGKRVGWEALDDSETLEILEALVPPGLSVAEVESSGDGRTEFLVGVGTTAETRYLDRPGAVPDAVAVRVAAEAALSPAGLWDEALFGLHAGLRRKL